MRRPLAVLALAAVSACTAAPRPDAALSPREDGLAAAMDAYLRRAAAFGFNGSVVVMRDGRSVLHRAYGWADPDAAVPMDTAMPFYVASVSKAFTAAAILRLEMAGRLGTSDSLGRFFPGAPAATRGVTLHQLLTHSSGMAEPPEPWPAARDDFVRAVLAQAPRARPGERFAYSNAGYSLLAAVVEVASGRPFGAYLRETLFVPAGMAHTRLVTDPPADARPLPVAMNGDLPQGGPWLEQERPFPWDAIGGTGIVTTTGDLARWMAALGEGTLLSPEAMRKLWTPALEDYAYGWTVRPAAGGGRLVTHDGLWLPEGWNAQVRIHPEQGTAVAVLSSTRMRDALSGVVARGLHRILFGGEVALPPAAAGVPDTLAARLAGTYRLPFGGELRLAVRGARLLVEPRGQDAANLLLHPGDTATNRHAAQNERTARFIDLLARGDWTALAALANRPEAEWRPRLERTWRWLPGRFGAFQGAEVINSAPGPFEGAAVDTWVRLRFARAAPVVRVTWDGERFVSMSDEGAFDSPSESAPAVPGAVPLAFHGPGRLAAHDLISATTAWFTVERDASGAVVALRTGTVRAERI